MELLAFWSSNLVHHQLWRHIQMKCQLLAEVGEVLVFLRDIEAYQKKIIKFIVVILKFVSVM